MPELPEVETTRSGIEPHIARQEIVKVVVRNYALRWPIDKKLPAILTEQTIHQIARRGKYLLLHCSKGTLILHLGMSGRVRILSAETKPAAHDHVDIVLNNKKCLRFTDPRRFGCLLWTDENYNEHFLLKHLGPEPLTDEFTAEYLFEISRRKSMPIKTFIMDSKVVVGVGNIYANEALFAAGIHPEVSAKLITKDRYIELVKQIKKVLIAAIKRGGTTLRDFTASDGKPGYFSQELQVYGRGNLPCVKCKTQLTEIRLGQRSTVFCGECQQ